MNQKLSILTFKNLAYMLAFIKDRVIFCAYKDLRHLINLINLYLSKPTKNSVAQRYYDVMCAISIFPASLLPNIQKFWFKEIL